MAVMPLNLYLDHLHSRYPRNGGIGKRHILRTKVAYKKGGGVRVFENLCAPVMWMT